MLNKSQKNSLEIIPAIIPKNYDDLREKVSLVKDFVAHIQVDITDGVFVPSKSWPYTDLVWSSGIFLELPCSVFCNFEFDLMVQNPEENIDDFIAEGAKRITLHIESTNNIVELVSRLKGRVEVGLAFNMETPFEPYKFLLSEVDFVQLMGIEKIGFQGEPFSEKVFEKIKDLKKIKSDVIISIDGGVNLENASRLIEVGVSRLVVGSSIFKSENIEETIKKFREIS